MKLIFCVLLDLAMFALLLLVLCKSPFGIELFVLGCLALAALRPAYAEPLCG